MANEELVDLLKAGVDEWNVWRTGVEWLELKIALVGVDLQRANLRGANLSHTDLRTANLSHTDLSGTNLRGADLMGADFKHANLNGADLSRADLSGADLSGANLSDADLRNVTVIRASFRDAQLTDADLNNAMFGYSFLGDLDLSGALRLPEIHFCPSSIDTFTLERTAQGLKDAPPERRGEVETFLRGAGVPELVMDAFQLMVESPIEFYSVFISYSHRDKPFARRLYEALQARGIRCWLDEHALLRKTSPCPVLTEGADCIARS